MGLFADTSKALRLNLLHFPDSAELILATFMELTSSFDQDEVEDMLKISLGISEEIDAMIHQIIANS